MRFIIMHRTNAHWEAGALPGRDLIARVGTLLQNMAGTGVLEGAEGLRPSCEGVRLTFASGRCQITPGPLDGTSDLPAGFTIVRAQTLEDAVAWATRQHTGVENAEVDVRPVTEPGTSAWSNARRVSVHAAT